MSVLRDFFVSIPEKKKREEKMEHRQKNIQAKTTGEISSCERKSSALLTAVEREKSNARHER